MGRARERFDEEREEGGGVSYEDVSELDEPGELQRGRLRAIRRGRVL